jgi:DNA polymerase-3 subunit alpha
MPYVPLHLHSEYSLLDGAIKLPELVKRARELGLPALALTDHGNLHGAIEFHDLCVKEGIQPILGCEFYVAPGSRLEKQSRHGLHEAGFHLILLARNEEGWKNLMTLSSIGYLQGFYYKPRIDKQVLALHSAGLTCLSGCLSGEIASQVLRGELPLARQTALDFEAMFGKGNFFLEIQDHGLPEQAKVNAELAVLSRETGIPMVATPDCHYLNKDDAQAHDVLLCVQTATTVDDPKRMRFATDEFYLKSEAQMREIFAWAPQAVDNSWLIAEACKFRLPKTKLRLPAFPLPPGTDENAYLEGLCRKGLPKISPAREVEAETRLMTELGVIAKLGYAGYFLIVADFVQASRNMGVRVGPGRGSAGGSLVAYLLGITAIDPLEKGLLFERFLNPERVSPPDIDVDFADTGRERVIQYVVDKYGREQVAQIVAFGRMAARAVVRDVGRALDYSYAEVDHLAKLVPGGPDISLAESIRDVPELRQAAAEPRAGRLLQLAGRLEGLARHASTHAAGVVIGDEPLINLVPLAMASGEGGVLTQFDMGGLERLGLVKMDFLGLRTLSVLDECLALIKATGEPEPDLDRIPDGDAEAFALLAKGEALGVFQLESWGMRDLLKRFKPRSLEDLDQLIALFRPGPMRMIDEYLQRRAGTVPVRYPLPELEPILKATYGVIVYQEQVMRVAMQVAGISAADADLMRRAMGKKDPELLEKQREGFLDGAVKRGVARDKADELFDLLARFAEYGFNKAHSAAYAVLAYQTAWLKAKYPAAFLAAVLSNEMGNTDKVVAVLAEARRAGVAILPPDINRSQARFSLEGNGIRFGLAAIKHVGEAAIGQVEKARAGGGLFKNQDDLLARVEGNLLNAKALEALIKAGALDCLQASGARGRAHLLAHVPLSLERATRLRNERELGQGDLFGGMDASASESLTPDAAPAGILAWEELEQWAFEKEVLGFYVSGHPLSRWEAVLKAFRCQSLARLDAGRDSQALWVGGIVLGVKHQVTKRQESMARLTLEDFEGLAEVLVWPRVMEAARALVRKDALLLVRGRLDLSGDEAKISAEEILPLEQALARAKALHVRLDPQKPAQAQALHHWATQFSGRQGLVLHVQEQGHEVLQKAGLGLGLSPPALESLAELGLDAWLEA